ncbi:hypothetical protein MATL_G00209290 [Megalops atlanticus]|uniref:N-acetylmuramoyl-L-alanine amidase-like n=1 Tax=Megalops atlanticus TaxID=7932 RepID=A0A9D3T3F9_MEGAT|nr:hypothetical protein MATL_G00209290 [Megalops atlanticus]
MESLATCITLLTLLGIITHTNVSALPPRHMEHFIRTVEHVEGWNPLLKPLAVVRALRQVGGLEDCFIQHFLGAVNEEIPTLTSEASDFIRATVRHKVTDRVEEGVVLTVDGTTVALAPLLLGIEAGLLGGAESPISGLYPLTLAKTLGLSFLHSHDPSLPEILGPDGCWDSMTSPQVFTLSGERSLVTDALINGGMDGIVLGVELSACTQHPLTLSGLLKQYYHHQLQGEGLDFAPNIISPRRRKKFGDLANPTLLQEQVLRSLALYQRLMGDTGVEEGAGPEAAVKEGVQLFVNRYMECPAIIQRCQWEAKPYRGTPTELVLPLSFMYIHHTFEPSQPCLSFQQCSANMRAMQRFHQDDRGWDDIGYSFVVGSDGYIYEGRGWKWRGAHTKGHNSRGYGISFIGDYTANLPARHALELVRDQLAVCAVGGGQMTANFTMHGHRQLVNTSCPGDALYSEIQGWEHFREVQP